MVDAHACLPGVMGTARANRFAAGVSPPLHVQPHKKPKPRHTASFSINCLSHHISSKMAACIESFAHQPFTNHLSEAQQESKMRLEAYDPNTYQSLPAISDAVARLDTINGENLVATSIRQLFLDHKMDRTYGLILLHRHFDLDESERLVEYGGTSVPWRLSKISKNIRASNWLVSTDGTVRPYEFCYFPIGDEAMEPDLSNANQVTFLVAFTDLLSKHNAEGLWGLCRYPGDDFTGRVEVTEGRANINLKPEDVSDQPLHIQTSH